LHTVALGTTGRRVEDVTVDVPGQQTRVSSDEPGLSIGDPVGIDFDVHDVGAGELTVRVVDVDAADGLLVRMYRREALSAGQARARDRVLDLPRKNHLARWTWELAWDEASPEEQQAILMDRWRRVGALRGAGHDLRSIAVALVPPAAESRAPRVDESLGGTTLRGDERLGFLVHKNSAVRISSDLSASLTVVLRSLRGSARTEHAPGEVSVTTTSDDECVEVATDRDALINVTTADQHHVDWFGYTQAWRVSDNAPAIVESPDVDRLLRVTLRRPVERDGNVAVSVDADVEVTAPSQEPMRRRVHGDRARSRFDRYEGFDPTLAPTDRFAFYIAVPRGGTASITALPGSPVDVSLAELDDSVGPERLAARAPSDPPVRMIEEGILSWNGFVPRRPTNASAFAGDRPLVRIAKRFVETPAPTSIPPLVRFEPPEHRSDETEEDGIRFDHVVAPFRAEVDGQRPAIIPFQLSGEPGTEVLVHLRSTKALHAGIFDHVTLPRTVVIGAGRTRATLLVGDDIPKGPVTLEVLVTKAVEKPPGTAPSPTKIHLPRASRQRAPLPHWIAGEFEE